MNFKKALSLLELKEGFTEEDLKKQFRKLAAKYHPDVNKSPDAEKKSKEISEAHSFLKEPKNWNRPINNPVNPGKHRTIRVNFGNSNFRTFNVEELFKRQIQMNFYQVPAKTIKIPLKDAILGCSVKTSVDWVESCSQCPKDKTDCKVCNNTKQNKKSGNWNLTLVPGIQHNSTVVLDRQISGKNYKFSFVILIDDDPNFSRQGNDIYVRKHISLLEALRGGKISVDLFDGKCEIDIKSSSKNNDVVIVKNRLPNSGSYNVILIVNYPENISDLIKFLEKDVK
jgi:curved DNA-binding protein